MNLINVFITESNVQITNNFVNKTEFDLTPIIS